MFLACEALTADDPRAPRMLAAAEPLALFEVLQPGVSLAIWGRALPRALQQAASGLAGLAPFSRSYQGSPDQVAAAALADLPPPRSRVLAADLRFLALLFQAVSARPVIRLRLEGVADDGCPRFHADAVRLRLLCTYCGAGTEWLPLPGGEAAQPPDPAVILRLPAGAVAVMRGEAGLPGHGCIHRSPPMPRNAAGRALRPRLLLCLDEGDED
ncbi:hypothetical protein CR162_19925 [Pseudoroseomonas rhizosphaerae]|uniref:DUF1826 domain-containing protein n=1 Tax=Teichococcus rhizosphaerae TaxID=1335062 RepID=A0A2C7A763_9PROT|nr:DUF1826 domain-containing protein [Pseudoroseomonas rhizosphaerae]PHK93175.1 hypothetical protein CR162_19925 [Pseudoroseomonas rhizosphaerae]